MSSEHVVLGCELHESFGIAKEAILGLGADCTLREIADLVSEDSGLTQECAYKKIVAIMEAAHLINVDISEVSLDARLVSDLYFGIYD